uniref:C-type lectin domain-containing protein n=1 Tax=Neogobius melanostomus TaxID=47308 RepID=A0A8C6S658_9GOBI
MQQVEAVDGRGGDGVEAGRSAAGKRTDHDCWGLKAGPMAMIGCYGGVALTLMWRSSVILTSRFSFTVQPCVVRCDAGWRLNGTKCYHFSSNRLNWTESRDMCQRLRGDLVKIESREEQEFLDGKLQTEMIDNGDKFWIGLTDSEAEGQWVWTDGSPLNSSLAFWADNDDNKEPDNWTVEDPEGEDCVRMGQKPFIEGLKWWYDRSCQIEQRSICEKTAKIL